MTPAHTEHPEHPEHPEIPELPAHPAHPVHPAHLAHPALVLAAGASRRMGRCKLCLPFPPDPDLPLPPVAAQTVLGRVLWSARAAGCAPLWVVFRPPLSPALAGTLKACPFALPVPAPLAHEGQAESLKAGVRAVLAHFGVTDMPGFSPSASVSASPPVLRTSLAFSGLMLLLGDQPLLPWAFIKTSWDWHEGAPDRASAPVHEGQRGHPVIVPPQALADMLALTGDTGARGVLVNYRLRLRPTDVTATVTDLDTQTAYEAALQTACAAPAHEPE